jgi:methionine-rich copper-binding protein CopC
MLRILKFIYTAIALSILLLTLGVGGGFPPSVMNVVAPSAFAQSPPPPPPPPSAIPPPSSLSPADGASGIATDTNLVLTFSNNIYAGTGTLTIKKSSDDSTIETITLSGAQLSGHGSTELTINPSVTLEEQTEYYILWSVNAFKDSDGTHTSPITSTTYWNFTTINAAPTAITFSPADGSTSAGTTDNLVITFSESVQGGTGAVVIKTASDDATVESIEGSGGLVSGSGTTTITLDPTNALTAGTAYYVQIEANTFLASSGRYYAGISDTATWNFSVASAASTGGAAARAARVRRQNSGILYSDTKPPSLLEVGMYIPITETTHASASNTEENIDESNTETLLQQLNQTAEESPQEVDQLREKIAPRMEKLRERTCLRVERFLSKKPIWAVERLLPRVNERLGKRWGFSCGD